MPLKKPGSFPQLALVVINSKTNRNKVACYLYIPKSNGSVKYV